jgi:hypothetical protein
MAKSVEIALRRVLHAYALMTSTDEVVKVGPDLQRYLETLEQGGQTDPSQLAVYGFACRSGFFRSVRPTSVLKA